MSLNAVQDGNRLTYVATVAHKAGDLICINGFYGKAEDDCAAGELAMIILDGVHRFANVPSTLSQGALVAAPATEMATTIDIGLSAEAAAASGVVPGNATTGWNVFGRVWETGNATLAAIQLFNPRNT